MFDEGVVCWRWGSEFSGMILLFFDVGGRNIPFNNVRWSCVVGIWGTLEGTDIVACSSEADDS